MNKDGGEEPRFHIFQPLRDPESNWAVDVAKNLEEYLVKICSGEVTGDDEGHLSINFAEAALLLQGSVQVYSRKVEYLYKLVLHALEFLSQKRQQDHTEKPSDQPGESDSNAVADDENEPFLGLDDVPVEAKNCLDDGHNKDDASNLFVKPPANLVVLEGDCFDSIGDVGELESYLLATHDLYRDFILLDPCDATAVDKYLMEGTGGNASHTGSSSKLSKTRKNSFQTPTKRSGGSAHKSPFLDGNLLRTPENNHDVELNDNNIWPDFPAACDNDYHEEGFNDGYAEPMDESDDEDDPWKPLNPHENGNLKIKPFKKGKNLRRPKMSSTKLMTLASQFPPARLNGIVSPIFKEMWEVQLQQSERVQASQSPPLYEQLRQSLTIGENESCDAFTNPGVENEDNEDENDIPDFTMPESPFMDAEGPLHHDMHDGDDCFGSNEVFEQEDPQCQASLEDLCRSHLDALLASIAETEKQTELAARVSTWKQRIESTLEEQDSRPPFDIQEYGERVLDKLSMEGESGNGMSFADVVSGQEKHEVARTFSALLQLVNNRSIDLDKGESAAQPVCFTNANPFRLRLITHVRPESGKFRSKKRGKSPMVNIVSKAARRKSLDKTHPSVSTSSKPTLSVSSSLQH
ncbi:Condensin-2 complex subunit h2 [Thalictrum thalictroides]|uniref:Condensin-2 complex subunit H2 n=1 Tax=Thalictrum thalictroides TaxID=46969 RepID=A0A7J6WFK1_THATH|nr:Condensin-2 complex subunit h2 [Thalictrum thalictroides]